MSEGFLPSCSLILGKCAVGQEEKDVVMRVRFLQNIPPSQTSASATAAIRQPSDHEPFVLATEEQQQQQQQQQQQRIGHYCRALGGEIRKIKLENDNDGFLTKLSVPTFATFEVAAAAADPSSFDNIQGNILQSENNTMIDNVPIHAHAVNPKQKNTLDGIIPGAFLVEDAIHPMDCESIIEACEKIGFGKFNAGKNNHGAMQILVTEQAAHAVGRHIFKYLDVDDDHRGPYQVVGLNQRWRIYRYEAGGEETFAPHIDAGFPPSALSKDGTTLIWDASSSCSSSSSSSSGGGGQDQQGQHKRYPNDTVSRLTVLMYLNDDFEGGHTNFYAPLVHSKGHHHHRPLEVIASITPKTGSILLFPQAVGEEAVEYARQHWPLHEGSPVFHGRPKYVIRSDVLFAKVE